MSVRTSIVDQVAARIASPSTGRQIVSAAIDDGQLSVHLDELQPLACELWQLDVETSGIRRLDTAGLKRLGATLAKRVRYLLEPLGLHEVDEQGGMLLRSSPPQRESHAIRYFEVHVDPSNRLRLLRFEKLPREQRRQVSAVVTVETLGTLCEDIAQVVCSPR